MKLFQSIEYDGQQHYWPIGFAGHGEADAQEAFDKVLTRDSIKTEFCESNNISLLRIPYWEQNNISNIISIFYINNSKSFCIIIVQQWMVVLVKL